MRMLELSKSRTSPNTLGGRETRELIDMEVVMVAVVSLKIQGLISRIVRHLNVKTAVFFFRKDDLQAVFAPPASNCRVRLNEAVDELKKLKGPMSWEWSW